MAIEDALHAFCVPLVRRSARKLSIDDNLTLLRELRAFAVNYNAKLATNLGSASAAGNVKFMYVMLNADIMRFGCYRLAHDQVFSIKELTKPKAQRAREPGTGNHELHGAAAARGVRAGL